MAAGRSETTSSKVWMVASAISAKPPGEREAQMERSGRGAPSVYPRRGRLADA
jgi:hypothetical protein